MPPKVISITQGVDECRSLSRIFKILELPVRLSESFRELRNADFLDYHPSGKFLRISISEYPVAGRAPMDCAQAAIRFKPSFKGTVD